MGEGEIMTVKPESKNLTPVYSALSLAFSVPKVPVSDISASMKDVISHGQGELVDRVGDLAVRLGKDPYHRIQYARLFYGPYSVPVPLYESVYREGTIMGRTATQVSRYYARGGLEMESSAELPDHLSVELEFLAYLSYLETIKPGAPGSLKEEFLRHHVLTWLPEVSSSLENQAPGSVYLELARAAEAACRADWSDLEGRGDGGGC